MESALNQISAIADLLNAKIRHLFVIAKFISRPLANLMFFDGHKTAHDHNLCIS